MQCPEAAKKDRSLDRVAVEIEAGRALQNRRGFPHDLAGLGPVPCHVQAVGNPVDAVLEAEVVHLEARRGEARRRAPQPGAGQPVDVNVAGESRE